MAIWATLLCSAVAMGQGPGDPVIAVDAGRVLHRISPYLSEWRHAMERGRASYTFPPRSFTVLRFE